MRNRLIIAFSGHSSGAICPDCARALSVRLRRFSIPEYWSRVIGALIALNRLP